MEQKRLSDYTEVTYEESDANPLRIAVRAATGGGHEFGDAGEVYLSDNEGRELRDTLDEIYG